MKALIFDTETTGMVEFRKPPEDPSQPDLIQLGIQPDEASWTRLAERAGDRPIWMLNFLEFAKTAVYADDAQDVAAFHSDFRRPRIRALRALNDRFARRGGWTGRMVGLFGLRNFRRNLAKHE